MIQKIREALARRNESGNGSAGPADGPPSSFWADATDQDKQLAGWISPSYRRSREVKLDPQLLARNRCLMYLDNTGEAESFRVMRAQVLQRTRDAGANMIMVTSAFPDEGKTTTSINLAIAIARDFQHTVLLVDSDLRKQSVHKYLGCPGDKGLIDHLTGGTPLEDLVMWPGIEKLTMISGGRLVHESAEIIGSPRMRELIPSMKARYPERYIIMDAPPILTGADVLTLAPLVDRIIVVVRAGTTSMDDLQKALQYLPQDKIMGFILNRSASPQASYYYQYPKQRQR